LDLVVGDDAVAVVYAAITRHLQATLEEWRISWSMTDASF
jgi:hypothetical protein